jgi:predicted nucleotidyltransferase
MLQTLVSDRLTDLSQVFRDHKVKSAYVFGSVCSNRFSETSDVDFVISFKDQLIPLEDYADNYFDLLYKLEALLGRDVDLITERTLKNPILVAAIGETRIPIFHG